MNDFLRQVVVCRRDIWIRKWTRWLREDLSSRPYAELRPDFVPPSPFLVVTDPQTESSRILVKPHLIDAEFRKAWMPYFCRSGHPVVTADQFLDFCWSSLASRALSGSSSEYGTGLKSLLLVGWMGGLGTSLRHSRYAGSLVWLFFWSWLRRLVSGHKVFWMHFFATIPKADGDSTPLGQRPLSVLPVVYRLWASLRLGHLREWVEGWLPKIGGQSREWFIFGGGLVLFCFGY